MKQNSPGTVCTPAKKTWEGIPAHVKTLQKEFAHAASASTPIIPNTLTGSNLFDRARARAGKAAVGRLALDPQVASPRTAALAQRDGVIHVLAVALVHGAFTLQLPPRLVTHGPVLLLLGRALVVLIFSFVVACHRSPMFTDIFSHGAELAQPAGFSRPRIFCVHFVHLVSVPGPL